MAALTFTYDVEGVLHDLGMFGQKLLQELLHVSGHLSFRGDCVEPVVTVAESTSDRLVDPNHVGI